MDHLLMSGILILFFLQYRYPRRPRYAAPIKDNPSQKFLFLKVFSSSSFRIVVSPKRSLNIEPAYRMSYPLSEKDIVPNIVAVAPIFTPISISLFPTYIPLMCGCVLPWLPKDTTAYRTDKKNELRCSKRSIFLLFSSHFMISITRE